MAARRWWQGHHTRGAATGAVLGALLMLTLSRWGPSPGPDLVACTARVPVKVVSSTEKDRALSELADRYAEARRPAGATCGDVTVVAVSSGIAEQILAGDPKKDPAITDRDRRAVEDAQVWSPSSALWLDRWARDAPGRGVPADGPPRLARSPMVLAMPQALAEELGWDSKPPTWPAAMRMLRDHEINYTQENPRTSTSGAMATYLTFAAAIGKSGPAEVTPAQAGRDAKVRQFVQAVQRSAVGGFVNDSTDILRTWSTDKAPPARTVFMIQEQMVWGYNTGQYGRTPDERPAVPLVAVHPVAVAGSGTESIVADHPYVTLPDAGEAERAAAADFLAFIEDNGDVLCKQGFQTRAGKPAAACPVPAGAEKAGRIDLGPGFRTLALPAVDVQEVMVDQWRQMRSPRRILIAMDVSGSMQKARLDSAVAAVKEGIRGLRPQDQVGVVQFAGTGSYSRPYWTVLEMGQKGLTGLDSRPVPEQRRQTALLATADYAYRTMSDKHRVDGADVLDAVIIVSDGIDDWDNRAGSVESVCQSWAGRTHVPVYTIYYAPDPKIDDYTPAQVAAGQTAMARLTTCTEPFGSAVLSSEERPLQTVFSQVMGAL
ncbi:vWA domain-containing protein [Actinoplanes sp. NPDC049596]|uniref:vWA domain-containing protein n=1 Tax=unclassified Actinoplanes TaxID=2626549 RepID=UPI0034344E4C